MARKKAAPSRAARSKKQPAPAPRKLKKGFGGPEAPRTERAASAKREQARKITANGMVSGTPHVVGGVGVARVAERVGPEDKRNLSGGPAWVLQVPDWQTGNVLQTILLPDQSKIVHRAPADKATAKQMLAALHADCTPKQERWDLRYSRLRSVLANVEPVSLAAGLRELYAVTERGFGVIRLTDVFEQFVFAELALALGEKYADVRGRVRAKLDVD